MIVDAGHPLRGGGGEPHPYDLRAALCLLPNCSLASG